MVTNQKKLFLLSIQTLNLCLKKIDTCDNDSKKVFFMEKKKACGCSILTAFAYRAAEGKLARGSYCIVKFCKIL